MASAEGKQAEEKGGEEPLAGGGDSKATWTQIDFSEVEMGDKIGGGGVGVIYRGWYKDQEVALKTLFDPKVDDELLSEYRDELLVMSQLDHPNIVSFMGASMTPPNLFFVMELCQNSLYGMLHDQRLEFTAYERVQIANDVASAMEYLHENKIIHRDIKSHNCLVTSNGIVKLCDFGLVKTKNTQAGTPAYMAPELLENTNFNKSVDVYAFGILLWELFTGEVPFAGYEIPDIINQVTSGNRLRVPTVDTPVEMRRMIEDCWAQDPDARPTFAEILVVLGELLRDMPQQSEVDLLAEGGGGDALDDIMFSGK